MALKRARADDGVPEVSDLGDVLEGCDAQPAAKQLLEKLRSSVDLSPVLQQLRRENGSSPDTARLQLRELQRFLVLKALSRDGEEPGKPLTLSPSRLMDQAWHCLMLRPKLYVAASRALGFADVIDHDPMGWQDAERPKRVNRTAAMYAAVFGVAPPLALWAERGGAAAPPAVPAAAAAALAASAEARTARAPQITIKVKDQSGGEVSFCVRRTTPFEKVFETYCARKAVDLHGLAFDFEGSRLKNYQTPADLDMEDGDEIQVRLEQTGC